MIRITDFRIEDRPDGRRISASFDGRELWYLYPDAVTADLRAEPFLGVAMLLAMSRHVDIAVDPEAPVSADYLRSFEAVQRAFRQWNPGFRHAAVHARIEPRAPLNDGVLCSFSCGVDSLHSFIENEAEITHLLTLGGVDYVTGPRTGFREIRQKTERFAAEFGKTPVVIDNNIREVCDALGIRWNYAHGAILCSIAAGLGFPKYIIPGSYSYRDLKPWGSHPLIDPLWSTPTTQVVHDGVDALRTDKTANIARHPDKLRHLQVCKHSQVSNCDHCPKCVRTALTLHVLGIEESPIPCADPARHIPGFVINHDLHAAFLWDVLQLARERGAVAVAEACEARLRRYRVDRHFRGLFKAVLGDKVIDKVRKRHWNDRSILLTDPSDFK